MPSVLVVEDEADLRDLLRRYLRRDGFDVLHTGSGAAALEVIADAPPDLVLLDLGLPDVDGLEVLRESMGRVPVIVLSARATTDERIAGLSAGADDYVTKPFSPTEVVLRVRAVLARGPRRPTPQNGALCFCDGRLVIDENRHTATLDGEPLDLTVSEWTLLTAMAAAPRRVFSRSELGHRLHGYDPGPEDRSIDSHIKNLRHKLGASHGIIETVVGLGYRLGCDRHG